MHKVDAARVPVIDDNGSHFVSCAMPIITEGDVIGCVCSVMNFNDSGEGKISDELEVKLVQTASGFLGKQLES